MQTKKSFTLIELLVVISIIGLFSSIVLVNLQGAREKARIAKVLEFSQSIYHVLGVDAIGIWGFDEGIGTTAYDSSGYGNNGTINGASPVAGILGNALNFNGNSYVDISSLKNIGDEITIEMWIKTNSLGWTMPFSANQGNNDLGIYLVSTTYINFRTSSAASFSDYGTTNANLTLNTWHHIVCTRSSDGAKRVYQNGILLSGSGGTNQWRSTILNAKIGARESLLPGYYFNGPIDEVRIYSQALTVFQIQQRYAEGLERHQLVKN